MSRAALLAAVLCLACAVDEDSNYPDPSGLYRIEADGPVCDGATVEVAPDTAVCRFECLRVDGKDVRSVALTFKREDAVWRHTFTAWDFGACYGPP